MRVINKIIVHCTATKEGQDFDIEDVRNWHVEGNGWRDVGYHYVVKLDGTIQLGRPLEVAGAHCKGHNEDSIGVCYVGGLDGFGEPCDTRTTEQVDSLGALIYTLVHTFPGSEVYGHRDFANKACPSFDARKEYQ